MSRADLAIRGALVYDGSGAEPVRADVAVTGDRIQAVGDLGATAAEREVDARGLALAPGFIDVHTHDDRHLLAHPDMAAKVSQGVTTVVAGNCGISLAPITRPGLPPAPFDLLADRPEYCFASLGDYFRALDQAPAATNAVALIGHSVLRYDAMADLGRAASDAEVATMQGLLAEAMDDGAIGLSTGLFYPPARASSTAEVAAVAEALRPGNGIYTTHMRDETDGILASIEEAAAVGRQAGVQVVISHHKCVGRRNHGRSVETLALIDKLRAELHLGLDLYPYIAGSTVLLPEMLGRAERVLVTWSKARPEFAGRDLAEAAAELGLDLEDAARALQPAGAIYFMMDEADVRRIMAYPGTMIGSDGLPSDAHPHPRLWGTFPRVLGRYARDEGVLTLADAVRRMSGLPAAEFGLKQRGLVKPGFYADLVLFDPATVIDRATFEAPMTPAAGIDTVWVNGEAVWSQGQPTGAHPGRAIRRQETNRVGPG
jgi:N-acyl-D-amino-acid deacylase